MSGTTMEVTTPSDTEVQVTRVFDASPVLVFDAHVRPELIRRWLLGPPGWTMPVCEVDFRVGGEYHYRWRNEADGAEFGFRGEFLEIERPQRIVTVERPDDAPASVDGAINTMTLAEEGGRTVMTLVMRFPTPEVRDQALGTGMTDGMASSYDRLNEVLRAAPAA